MTRKPPVSGALTPEALWIAYAEASRRSYEPARIIMHPTDYATVDRLSRVITIFGGNPWGPVRHKVDFDMLVAPRLTRALRRLKMYRWYLTLTRALRARRSGAPRPVRLPHHRHLESYR